MSKVLKTIVNVILFCAIVVAAGLLIPPFAGITTVMVDDVDMQTNLPQGSVAYAVEKDRSELKQGDKVLISQEGRQYVYVVDSIDGSSVVLDDQLSTDGGTTQQELGSTVQKVMLVVPVIGYVSMALRSTEGLIIVGLAVVFVIILIILAEVWKKDDDEEEEAFDNPTRLDRLKPYLQTPRDMETPFFRAVAGNAPWLFKDRWKKKYTESPVIYAAVVQANSALWRPGDNDYYPAVFVFALDKKHTYDVEWLSQMAEKISELSDSPTVPDDCRKLINTLRDSQSEFCFRIGKSVSGDADAWCATYKFDKQSALPRKALPSDGIVPFLLKANPVENQFVDFKLIPSELYIG